MIRPRNSRQSLRLLATTGGCCLAVALSVPARAQMPDLSGGDSGIATGGSSDSGSGGGYQVPATPPQPGGIDAGPTTLPTQSGQSLRDRLSSALGVPFASSPTTPALQFTPGIGVQQGWTSNVFATPGNTAVSAFFTNITPSIAVAADTSRVQLSANYAPNFIIYEPSRNQDTIAQNLSGQAHVTLVPDEFYVDASAFASPQSIAGGYGPPGTVVPNQATTAQSYAFSISPYYAHQFGGTGTITTGVSLSEAAQLLSSNSPAAFQGYNQTSTSTMEFLRLASGEDFGRVLSTVNASGEQSTGTGVLANAYQYTASYQAGYAITHALVALATIGWENLHYSGFPPVNINGPLWNVGAQYTPTPTTSITVRYGRTDGINAAYVNASIAPTARTLITANYSVTLSTDVQQLQSFLPSATTDAAGNLVNAQTGLPLLQNANFMGINDGVYQLQSAVVTASLMLDRDTFQVTFNHQRQIPISSANVSTGLLAQTGTFGSVSWQHDLSRDVQTSLFVQYGTYSAYSGTGQSSPSFVGSATVSYALSSTLHAMLQYSYTSESYGFTPTGAITSVPAVTSVVLVGLQKTF